MAQPAKSSMVLPDIRNYFSSRQLPQEQKSWKDRRAIPGSLEEDELFANMPESRFGNDARRRTAPPPQASGSRIEVVLPASPSRKSSLDKGKSDSREGLLAYLSQTVRKETPVPLPKFPRSWSDRMAAASASSSIPTPTSKTSTPVTAAPNNSSRGRPKGWKPGMSYAVMRGKRPPPPHGRARQTRAKAPPQGFAKRRGRTHRPPSPAPELIYQRLEPSFVDFLCEWAGCKAELHNLDTLRRHVYAVHGRGETCRWGKCAASEPSRELPSSLLFRHHMEEAHLIPFAWHTGDGPRNRGGDVFRAVATAVPDYLKDAAGNQVTPSIRDQELEDYATWRDNRRKLKNLLIQRDKNLPDDTSDETEDET
ncbi:hypothetical protein RJ55_02272 [Drechmeria coniospora]|nr:hypothetical protein RJ55_02272 [Drechmeria coniospora]